MDWNVKAVSVIIAYYHLTSVPCADRANSTLNLLLSIFGELVTFHNVFSFTSSFWKFPVCFCNICLF